MTPDDDSGVDEEHGGFVFGDDRSTEETGSETRLAPVVALVVVASLVLAGAYVAFGILDTPGDGPPGSIAGSDAGGGAGQPSADGTNATSAQQSPVATGSVTGRPPSSTPTDTATGSATDTSETPLSTNRDTTAAEPVTVTATPTATVPAPSTSTVTTVTTTSEADQPPSIESFSIAEQSGEIAIDWAVADPNADLQSIRIQIIADPDGDRSIVNRRTVTVSGAEASGESVLALTDVASGEAYEVQLEAEDRTGELALAVTRETASD